MYVLYDLNVQYVSHTATLTMTLQRHYKPLDFSTAISRCTISDVTDTLTSKMEVLK